MEQVQSCTVKAPYIIIALYIALHTVSMEQVQGCSIETSQHHPWYHIVTSSPGFPVFFGGYAYPPKKLGSLGTRLVTSQMVQCRYALIHPFLSAALAERGEGVESAVEVLQALVSHRWHLNDFQQQVRRSAPPCRVSGGGAMQLYCLRLCEVFASFWDVA